MTLSIDAGRIYIQDTNGDIVFDSDERLFVVTNSINGSHTVPERQCRTDGTTITTSLNIEDWTLLASVNAAADTVRGAFSVQAADGLGVSGVGWFNASGTYLHVQVAGLMAAYTFVVTGSGLYFVERTCGTAPPNPGGSGAHVYIVGSSVISYKLLCGTWV